MRTTPDVVLAWMLAAIMLAATTSCSIVDESPLSPPQTLEEAQSRWTAWGYDNYRFHFSRGCWCAPRILEATVYVHEDTVYAFSDVLGDGKGIDVEEYGITREAFVSIEQLFERIERGDPEPERVQYDVYLGYPEEAQLGDFSRDVGVAYGISEVRPLSGLLTR